MAADTAAEPAATEPRRRRGRPLGAKTQLLAEQATLGRHHFSYLRAAIQGVELRRAWSTYLAFAGGPNDERHFASELRTLRRIIRVAADQHGLGAAADLALAKLPGVAAAAAAGEVQPEQRFPTLEEFIEQRCAEFGIDVDFQTQDDWADEYRQTYRLDGPPPLPATALPDPPAPAGRGAAAPLAQRLQALAELEAALARRPALPDPLEMWLSRELAALLRGEPGRGPALLTLRNLVDFANVNGHRWWTKVPGLGGQRANRLVAWLHPHASALQHPLKPSTLRPVHELALTRETALATIDLVSGQRFGLVPLERLAVPPELDGRHGIFRLDDKPNTFGATSDLEAIRAWLARYSMSPRTYVTYARTAERFYLWSLLVRRKPLSSLVEEDLHAWRLFMARPPADWVQPRHTHRGAAEWRPFRGPLSPLSQRHSFTVIAALLSALVHAGYLSANAAKGVTPFLKLPRPKINKRRSFNDAQWHWVMETWQELYARAGPADKADEDDSAACAGEAAEAAEGVVPLIALPSPPRPDQVPARARELRRTRLILELGATTGLRRLEIATSRIGMLVQETFDGEPVWMLEVMGKGSRARRVPIFDDIKALIDQHQRDLVDAKIGVDERAPLRELLSPIAGAPGNGDAATEDLPGGEQGVGVEGMPAGEAGADQRPLVGALRPAPPRWRVDTNGVRVLDRDGLRQADRYAALDANALNQSLKRLFDRAGATAQLADPPLDPAAFGRASTHWMRHFFANNAVSDHVEAELIRAALGHSDLKTTSVYINPEETTMVRGLAGMRRRG